MCRNVSRSVGRVPVSRLRFSGSTLCPSPKTASERIPEGSPETGHDERVDVRGSVAGRAGVQAAVGAQPHVGRCRGRVLARIRGGRADGRPARVPRRRRQTVRGRAVRQQTVLASERAGGSGPVRVGRQRPVRPARVRRVHRARARPLDPPARRGRETRRLGPGPGPAGRRAFAMADRPPVAEADGGRRAPTRVASRAAGETPGRVRRRGRVVRRRRQNAGLRRARDDEYLR